MQKEKSLVRKDDWFFDTTPFNFKALKAKNRHGDEIEMAEVQIGEFTFQASGTPEKTEKIDMFHKGRKLLGFGGK